MTGTDDVAEKSKRYFQFETTSYNFSVNLSSGLANAFALRVLNLDILDIGILTSTRIFTYALSQLPGVFFASYIKRNRKLLWSIGGALNRIGMSMSILSVLLPYPYNFEYLLGLTTLTQFAGGIAGIAAGDLLGDLVSLEEAAGFWARINKLNYVAIASSMLTGTLVFLTMRNLLEAYTVVYLVSLVAAVFSTAMLVSIRDPGRRNIGNGIVPSLNNSRRSRNSRLPSISNSASKYLLLQLLFSYSVNLPAPFWDYLVLNVLGGNEVVILFKNMTGLMVKFFTIDFWKKKLNLRGSRRTMSLGMATTSLVPIAYITVPNSWMTVLAEAYSGFAWSSLDLTGALYTFYITPSEERPVFISLLNLSSNLIASAASFTGSVVAGLTGLVYAPFMISSMLRVISSGVAYRFAPEVVNNSNKPG
ncbi:hypothetical protein TCELL_0651 [Thermogladius calderae 1633]|uniref:MFS transporter n=1 Tax=Thermogladius calderae (strain DSM 22663 / VKM B-2946 / 1633) TaxID=1184251 RepID=I3TE87_THEC1|nr:hypothetical protein [Thermogladius calderae]AFK51075.1 hypothetical protein TCELL_0651 [Thermogladius calderae 1633]